MVAKKLYLLLFLSFFCIKSQAFTPDIPFGQTFNIDENSSNATQVGFLIANAVLPATNITEYRIIGGNILSAFAMNLTTGEITVNNSNALNFEIKDTYNLIVSARDDLGDMSTETITIFVNDLNEAPVMANQTFSLDENQFFGFPVGTVAANDPDAGDNVTNFMITAGNTGTAFAIDNLGEITVDNGLALDFETNPVFNLTVQVEDLLGVTTTATITINLTDQNDPPVITNQTFDVYENAPFGTSIGQVVASDPDAGQSLSNYSIFFGNDDGAFAISSSIGEITVLDETKLDFATAPTRDVWVEVADNGTPQQFGSGIITINVLDVNDKPTLDPIMMTPFINGNSAPKTLTLTGISAGPSNEIGQTISIDATSSKPSTLDDPTITYTSPDVTADLEYEALTDVTVITDVNITVTVSDDGGTANGGEDEFERMFTIQVVPILPAASGISSTPNALDAIDLNWANVDNMVTHQDNAGYEIWRSITSGSGYSLIGTNMTDDNTFTDTGLSTETIYYYVLKTINDAGNSDFSSEFTTTTKLYTPSNLVATATASDKITLTWTNNSSLAEGFVIERTGGSSGTVTYNVMNPSATSYEDTSIDLETTYEYKIKAVNSMYMTESDFTVVTSITTFFNAPTGFTAISLDEFTNRISWTNGSSSPDITGFEIQRAISSDFTLELTTIPVSASTTQYDDTDIFLEENYYYRVRAVGTTENSGYTNSEVVYTYLFPPFDIDIVAVTTTRNIITWQNTSFLGIGYELQRANNESDFENDPSSVTTFTISGASNTSYTDDLPVAGQYYYRVRTTGLNANSAYTNPGTSPTLSPTNLEAITISTSQINLSWTNNDPNIVGTQIERSENDQNNFVIVANLTGSASSYEDIGLTDQTQYFYRIRSISPLGFSEFSNVAGAFTADVPAIPSDLTLTVLSPNEIELQWNDNADNETSFRVERLNILDGDFFQEVAVINSAGAGAGLVLYTDNNLLANQTYSYRVRASNANGNSGYSNIASAITDIDPSVTPPFPPTNPETESVSDDQIDIKWSDESSDEVIFKIERAVSIVGPYEEVGQVVANTEKYQDLGLIDLPQTALYYRIIASNEGGDSGPTDPIAGIKVCNMIVAIASDTENGLICEDKSALLSINSNAITATYQWRKNGGNIQGATLPTYNASENGTYSCQVTSGSCVQESDDIPIIVKDSFDATLSFFDDALEVNIVGANSYQWFWNDVLIEGANTDTYSPTQAGNYFVIVTNDGCAVVSNVIIVDVTSLSESLAKQVSVYPNPSQGNISVNIENDFYGKYNITLIDLQGKKYKLAEGEKQTTILQKSFNLERFSKGSYILEFILGEQKTSKKIILK